MSVKQLYISMSRYIYK